MPFFPHSTVSNCTSASRTAGSFARHDASIRIWRAPFYSSDLSVIPDRCAVRGSVFANQPHLADRTDVECKWDEPTENARTGHTCTTRLAAVIRVWHAMYFSDVKEITSPPLVIPTLDDSTHVRPVQTAETKPFALTFDTERLASMSQIRPLAMRRDMPRRVNSPFVRPRATDASNATASIVATPVYRGNNAADKPATHRLGSAGRVRGENHNHCMWYKFPTCAPIDDASLINHTRRCAALRRLT